jgi:hypothetical protein
MFIKDFTHTAVLNLVKKIMIHIEMIYENTVYEKYKSINENKEVLDEE